MILWPKNQTYTSEPIVKTVIAPIFILLFAIGAALLFINPFMSPSAAGIFGLDEKVSLTVESVEKINPTALTKTWNCDHWRAYGTHEGRELFTRACNTQAPVPEVGDKLDVQAAMIGDEAYLLDRGDPNTTASLLISLVIALLALYGTAISFRLLYVGYTSNWSKTRK